MSWQDSDPLYFLVVVPGLAACSSQLHRQATLEPIFIESALETHSNLLGFVSGCTECHKLLMVLLPLLILSDMPKFIQFKSGFVLLFGTKRDGGKIAYCKYPISTLGFQI